MIVTTKHAGLAVALHSVMVGSDRSERSWRRMRLVMAEEVQARRFLHELDDVQQEVSIKLLRTTRPFSGDSDAAAYAFIRQVTKRTVIDRTRRQKVRPQALTWRAGDQDPLDRLGAPPVDTDATEELEAAAEDLLDRLLAEVDLLIEHSGKQATARELSRFSAHARVLSRLRARATAEIAVDLGRPEVTNACIEKWVERGLPLLLQALDQVAVTAAADERRLIENLRVALAKRRTDAGKPRQSRRKPAGAPK